MGQPAPYAQVVPAEALRPRLGDAAARGDVQRALEQLLSDVNRELAEYEQLRLIVVVREAWSVENGMLTPTMKIRRQRIEAAAAPHVESWYAQQTRVLWA